MPLRRDRRFSARLRQIHVFRAVALWLGLLLCFGCRIRREEPAPRKVTAPQASVRVEPRPSDAPRAEPARPGEPTPPKEPAEDDEASPFEWPERAIVIALGGIDLTPTEDTSSVRAVRTAARRLLDGSPALEAAVAGVVVLEDDPATHTGLGASLRRDGKTIECDAAVMSDEVPFKAVAAVRGVKNPVRLVSLLVDEPATLFAGEGASSLAIELRVPGAAWITERARVEWDGWTRLNRVDAGAGRAGDASVDANEDQPDASEGVDANLREATSATEAHRADADSTPDADAEPSGDAALELGRESTPSELRPAKLLGGASLVIVRTVAGHYAGAASSGGPVGARVGRVSEVALEGAALFVGPRGAVAVSGSSDELVGHRLARDVYARLELVRVPAVAARWGSARLRSPGAVAVVSELGGAVVTTRPTAWARGQHRGEASSATDPESINTPATSPASDTPSAPDAHHAAGVATAPRPEAAVSTAPRETGTPSAPKARSSGVGGDRDTPAASGSEGGRP